MEIISIKTIDQADKALSEKMAVIFKHSSHCPVSARAKKMYDTFCNIYCGDAVLYQVNVIEERNISQTITERTGIRHESPQLIIIIDGKPSWHASHHSITSEALQEHLNNL